MKFFRDGPSFPILSERAACARMVDPLDARSRPPPHGSPIAAAGRQRRLRRARFILLATVSLVALVGCQQVKETGAFIGERAGAAGRYVGDQVGAATSAVGRWASGRPEDDGTACYATERVLFYDAATDVKTAESMVFGAQLAGLVGLAVTTYSDSFATRLISAGFAVTMAALVSEIEADHERIERVTTTFDTLMACRRNEALMLKAEVDAGRMPRPEGAEAMARLRALVDEDLLVARETNQTLQARTAEFELSTEKAREEVRQAAAQPAQPATPAPTPPPGPQERQEAEAEIEKAEAAVQTNQQALSQQSATIEQAAAMEQSDAFELALLIDPFGEASRRATT
jgi:hypothetical protein